MTGDVQFRTAFDFRATDAEDVPGFEGYAATHWTADSYWTAFAPGAFRKTIKERGHMIPVLWNHNPDSPMGKHLELKEDKRGLYVNIGIADDGAEGSTFLKRMRFGVPFGMSFGFQTVKDRSAEDDDPIDLSQLPKGVKASDVRVITETKYWESSPVTFPANEAAGLTNTRKRQELDYLSTLIESMRAGTLTDEQAAQIEALWSEWPQHRAGADASHSTPDRAQRDREIQIALTLASVRGYLTGD
jgi:HK97 family phage prohead protease